MKQSLGIVMALLLLFSLGTARENPVQKGELDASKVSGTPGTTLLNINNINLFVSSNGMIGRNPNTGASGGHFPWVDTDAIDASFAEGLMWGGTVQGAGSPELRVGGATYSIGTVPGWILVPGDGVNPPVAASPNDPRVRVYRVRPDYQSLTVNDPQVRNDAAQLLEIPRNQVTDAQVQAVLDQYALDWTQWPTDIGAPYYDANGNGIYEPGTWVDLDNDGVQDRGEVEEPGLQMADQVIFLIINDTDIAATNGLYASPPIGLEVQITLWAYKNAGPLNNVAYKRYRVINKSGFNINEMYLAQWADQDIGDYTNDFSGCDSLLSTSYSYNSAPGDFIYENYNLPPAAVGYGIVQGPVVPSPGDSAIVDFETVADFRNLPMTSAAFFSAGSPIFDPQLRVYDGTLQWYNMLRGFTPTADLNNPVPYITGSGPNAGLPTRFPLSGDPLSGSGDVDGIGNNFPAGDRRTVAVSGPFNFANGEMQEIVIAMTGGGGHLSSNYLSAVEELRSNMRVVRSQYGKPLRLPVVAVENRGFSPTQSTVFVQADLDNFENVSDCQVVLKDLVGNNPDILFTLFDDGQHDDGAAGDGLWANTITVANRQYQHTGDIIITNNGQTDRFEGFINNLRLRPLPAIGNFQVLWENAIQDSAINNAERVHLSFTVTNVDQVNPIDNLRILNNNTPSDRPRQEISYQQQIAPGASVSDAVLFFDLLAPANGDSISFGYEIAFDTNSDFDGNTLELQVWGPPSNWGDTLAVIAIHGIPNNLTPIVADPVLLTGDIYEVRFTAGIDSTDLRWQLFNRNENTVLLSDQVVSDEIEFRHPVVDGIIWKISSGTLNSPGFINFETIANGAGSLDPPEGAAAEFQGFPSENPTERQQVGEGRWLIHTADTGNYASYESFLDRISRSGEKWPLIIPHDYEIRFTAGGSVAISLFQNDNVFTVPFELWNIGINTPDDPSDDYRMLPIILDWDLDQQFNFAVGQDHSVSSATNDPYTDWFYWYNPTDTSPGETGYQAEADQLLNDPANWVYENNREVMSRFVFVNWNGGETTTGGPYNQLLPEEGTIFRITTVKPNFPGDTLLINSPISAIDPTVPLAFALGENFPNPFNPKTDIRYQISDSRSVELVVYDVLGRKVKTLVNKKQQPGRYQVSWEGRNDAGQRVASGFYFYRLTAGDFVKTRKMILIR